MTKINLETKKIEFEMKISPAIVIRVGKFKLGTIEFDEFDNVNKFMGRLSESIKQIIKEFKKEKQ